MYIRITNSDNNKDVYIKQAYRKNNVKLSSLIYKKLGKYNDILEQFSGDKEKMMALQRKRLQRKLPFITSKKTGSCHFFKNFTHSTLFNIGYLFCATLF